MKKVIENAIVASVNAGAEAIKTKIESIPARSCWAKGVKNYAVDLFVEYLDNNRAKNPFTITEKDLLSGAKDWKQYSWGGCALCYDGDIAEALCTPSELKRTKNGKLPPNGSEQWLDVQARALYQAAQLILNAIATTADKKSRQMKLYILELYGDDHKERGKCDVYYFTSKKALIREMKKHIDEIGEIWSTAYGVNTLEEHAKFNFSYFDSELANVEIVKTNSPI